MKTVLRDTSLHVGVQGEDVQLPARNEGRIAKMVGQSGVCLSRADGRDTFRAVLRLACARDERAELRQVEALDGTERRAGGYGSTAR